MTDRRGTRHAQVDTPAGDLTPVAEGDGVIGVHVPARRHVPKAPTSGEIVIPCHRVVGSDGSLTGYAGGLERKRTLLDLEQATRPDGTKLF